MFPQLEVKFVCSYLSELHTLPGSAVRIHSFLQLHFILLLFILFKNKLSGNCRPVHKAMWNLFRWRGTNEHLFIRSCTHILTYELFNLFIWAILRHRNTWAYRNVMSVCTGEACSHKKPVSGRDRTHTSPKPALLEAVKILVQIKTNLKTNNPLATLHKGWSVSPPIFLASKVMVPTSHPTVLYYATVINTKREEHNFQLFCRWVTAPSRGQGS